MRRRATARLVALGVLAVSGCGGSDAAEPIATDPAPSTTDEPILVETPQSEVDDTVVVNIESPVSSPASTAAPAAPSSTSAASNSTVAPAVTEPPTTPSTEVPAPTTEAEAADGEGDDEGGQSGSVAQQNTEVGVLAMKNFLLGLLDDGVRLGYDDVNLDDIELNCVGVAQPSGLADGAFMDLLFDCLDDDSFNTIIGAIGPVDDD